MGVAGGKARLPCERKKYGCQLARAQSSVHKTEAARAYTRNNHRGKITLSFVFAKNFFNVYLKIG